jgi:hypothetical protein
MFQPNQLAASVFSRISRLGGGACLRKGRLLYLSMAVHLADGMLGLIPCNIAAWSSAQEGPLSFGMGWGRLHFPMEPRFVGSSLQIEMRMDSGTSGSFLCSNWSLSPDLGPYSMDGNQGHLAGVSHL